MRDPYTVARTLIGCSARGRLTRFVMALITVLSFAGTAHVFSPANAEETKPVSSDAVWVSSFKDLTGTMQALASYKGKTALIYFWATWCEPCQREGPEFQALYEKYKDKNFVVIGIAVDNADKVRTFVKQKGMLFPIVYGGTEAIKLSKDIGNSLGGIPYVVIIDQDGRIVERITGEAKEGRIEGIIAPLLVK